VATIGRSLRRRLEQGGQLLGLDRRPLRCRVLDPSSSASRRVTGGIDVPVVAGGVEDHRQQADRLVDLVRSRRALTQLRRLVAVDVLGADLVQVQLGEVGEEMTAQQPAVTLDRLLPQLRLSALQPLGCELVEGRRFGHLRSLCWLVRSPETALHIYARLVSTPPTLTESDLGDEAPIEYGNDEVSSEPEHPNPEESASASMLLQSNLSGNEPCPGSENPCGKYDWKEAMRYAEKWTFPGRNNEYVADHANHEFLYFGGPGVIAPITLVRCFGLATCNL